MSAPAVAMHSARYEDGKPFALNITRFSSLLWSEGFPLPSRKERWTVFARDEQEAHATVNYHFGSTVQWYSLARAESQP